MDLFMVSVAEALSKHLNIEVKWFNIMNNDPNSRSYNPVGRVGFLLLATNSPAV